MCPHERVVTRIMVIDDHEAVLDGLIAALSDEPSFEVITSHTSASEALAVVDRAAPAVIVIDQDLTGTSGIQTARRLRARWRRCRVVVMISAPRETLALAALSAGADGVVVKAARAGTLREAIRAVADGGTYIDPQLAGRIVTYTLRAHGLAAPETWTRSRFGEVAG